MTPPPTPPPPTPASHATGPSAVRGRLVLVLDVDDLGAATDLARRLEPWFGVAKVGYQLYGSVGPRAFDALHDVGMAVFADLKLHDIPTTVEHGARSIARHGVEFLNVHAAGGVAMVRAGAEGARAGAADAGHAAPVVLAVTVLTSEPDASAFDARLECAVDAGCDGVVCSAHEVARAKAAGMRTMVPGVRLPGGDHHDQARVATPDAVVAAGGDWLVVGRAVTHAASPEEAAARVAALAESALG